MLKPIGIKTIWLEIRHVEAHPRIEVEHDGHVKEPQDQVSTATDHVEPTATPKRNVDERRRSIIR